MLHPLPNLHPLTVLHPLTRYESSLALTHDGTVFSWGRGALGQLGHGGNPKPSSENRPRKVEVLGAVPISAIAAGNTRSF